ncbi:tetratricopeptide repeat protein [Streptomyces sp. enrichment culture]|uniref:tetratricopeptide repeat protein n=1 Tax=Streptomyces sp. enrichment culture TaxID=1795815 RepID=UPI003F5671F5
MKLPTPASYRSRRLGAALKHALHLAEEGRFEEAEAAARACQAAAGRLRGGRRLAMTRYAQVTATAVACAHGRGTEVLAEMEALVADLEGLAGSERTLLVLVRHNRATILDWQGQHAEAEAEAQALLRELSRLKQLGTRVWKLELTVLDGLAQALCGLGRPEEAEAIARGNLSRAEGVAGAEAALHCTLVRSLNGQGRHAEALTEARRFTPPRERGHTGKLDLATATALDGLGRRSEAADVARRALADCGRHLHPAHPRLGEARTLLARLGTAE